MKKEYKTPNLIIIDFANEDVIRTSGEIHQFNNDYDPNIDIFKDNI